jgi:formylglycine-generating enzyme required for sulfatase activity
VLDLTFDDWIILSCLIALAAMIGGMEAAQSRGLGRPIVGAMLLTVTGLVTLMMTSDMEDSVLFGGWTESGSRTKVARKSHATAEDDAGRRAGRDPSGPGDGEGGDGKEIKFALNAVLETEGSGAAGGGATSGRRSGGAGRNGSSSSAEASGGYGRRPPLIEEAIGSPPGPKYPEDCPHCPDLILVPPGKLTIGPGPDEPGAPVEDGTLREIRITNPFLIGRFEVTVEEFHAFVKAKAYRSSITCVGDGTMRIGRDYTNPGFEQTTAHPVVCVSWLDAQAYVRWLARTTGRRYRLPSENEWEYAARSAKRASGDKFVFGPELLESEANFGLLRSGTRSVGKYLPNKLGLFDVAGNAWEMVEDCFEADVSRLPKNEKPHLVPDCTLRVMRGGAWYNRPGRLRLSTRWANPQAAAGNGVGFRVARDLDDDEPTAQQFEIAVPKPEPPTSETRQREVTRR